MPYFIQILDASAGGMKWENVTTIDDETFQFHRLGAKAMGCLSAPLTVTLDEYADFIASEKKRLEAGQAERIGKQLRDF